MQTPPPHLVPREPEIEFLARMARRALTGLRCLLFVAGLAMIAGAIWVTLHPQDVMSEDEPILPLAQRIAHNLVFVCVGLPLLLPVRWLFARGRWPALGGLAVLWFGPMLLEGDHAYGWLIRFFASFVAFACLLVWRTLSSLSMVPPGPH
ncbi:MAG TPA: hypothetical protein VFZ65_04220 [Planctomycetota bacterium]|nr:hypothetical protein [Planctomycetota bacterium]